jgi:tRNA(fMet)-specific endonuclease VapC
VTWLLDTNACIGFLSGRAQRVLARIREADPADLRLCSIVKAELLFGARKSARPSENLARLGAFFAPFQSLPLDDRAADHAGRIRAALQADGTPIGPNDLLIASIALAQDLTLVTHNLSEFGRVQGLRIEDWEA